MRVGLVSFDEKFFSAVLQEDKNIPIILSKDIRYRILSGMYNDNNLMMWVGIIIGFQFWEILCDFM